MTLQYYTSLNSVLVLQFCICLFKAIEKANYSLNWLETFIVYYTKSNITHMCVSETGTNVDLTHYLKTYRVRVSFVPAKKTLAIENIQDYFKNPSVLLCDNVGSIGGRLAAAFDSALACDNVFLTV